MSPSWKIADRQVPAMIVALEPSEFTIVGTRLPTTCHEMIARIASLAAASPSLTRA